MMKFKPNQTRTYDREGFKKRAACLCFRNEREDEVRPGDPPPAHRPGVIPCLCSGWPVASSLSTGNPGAASVGKQGSPCVMPPPVCLERGSR